jgi:hypothetical protein
MRTHERALPLAACLGLALALCLFGGSASACSICLAGDPSFSSQGASAQQAGDVAAYFEVRAWEKESGLLPHEHQEPEEPEDPDADHGLDHEHDANQRLDLYLSWTPLDRLTLTLGLPWAFNQIVEVEDGASAHLHLAGFGDASLLASAVLWRNRPALPSTWVELRGFVKAPTGRSEDSVDGVEDPHLQPGTGSWDAGLGAAAVHRFEWGALYGSAFHRWNREGGFQYQYGDVTLASLASEAPLGHLLGRPELDAVTPGLGLDFRHAGYDEQDGERYRDSGGSILYAAPFVRARLPIGGEDLRVWLRAGAQIPLTNAWLHGFQDEDPVWSLGVGVGF